MMIRNSAIDVIRKTFKSPQTRYGRQEDKTRRYRHMLCVRTTTRMAPIPYRRLACNATSDGSENRSRYQTPSTSIKEIIEAKSTPVLSFSPCRTKIMQLQRPSAHPPIADFVKKELKLAGVRFDPEMRAPSKMSYYIGMSFVPLSATIPSTTGAEVPVNIPSGMRINYASWAPDGKHIAFTLRGSNDSDNCPLALWIADTETGEARQLLDTPKHFLSSVFATYSWISSDTILASVIPYNQESSPIRPPVPVGPFIKEHDSFDSKQSRTYPDLLKDEHDCEVFSHYTSSDLVLVRLSTGEVKRFSDEERIYTGISPSPDGNYVLVSYIEEPFSFALPCGRFPKKVELWSASGEKLREVASLPLAEDIPIAFNACRKGPRSIGWRSDKDSTLGWAEAQDGGDPSVEASPRDVVYSIDAASFAAGNEAKAILSTELRFSGASWINDNLAFSYESWWDSRRLIWSKFSPSSEYAKTTILDRNYEDAYSDPGSPVVRRTKNGSYVVATFENDRYVLLLGEGASPSGNRPFLDLYELSTGSTKRLWQSKDPYYESLRSLMCDGSGKDFTLEELSFLLSRESQNDPTQYFLLSWPEGLDNPPAERQLTDFPHPYPQLKGIQKKVLRYKREDGVDLTATLYLPPGYDAEKDGPLPCLFWAYPREFKSKDAAGQVRRSSYTFSYIGGTSPLLWLAEKYAILDGPTMPIIGEGDEEPNDSYVKQLVASAEAAVDEVVKLGVAQRDAIAVGGHSYGAFMTANLLAHAPHLFCCGIARSGAYNRTLTPFGFQSEQRTIWQARDTYVSMSPYLVADKIQDPILLIHGDEDNNTGTSKIQSERFFDALKGHGIPSKLVLLPHESHSYRARESILHCLYEMDGWLSKYCRSKIAVKSIAKM